MHPLEERSTFIGACTSRTTVWYRAAARSNAARSAAEGSQWIYSNLIGNWFARDGATVTRTARASSPRLGVSVDEEIGRGRARNS